MSKNLDNLEAMLDEIMERVSAAVPSEGERSYIESGIRTTKHWLYQAMRDELDSPEIRVTPDQLRQIAEDLEARPEKPHTVASESGARVLILL